MLYEHILNYIFLIFLKSQLYVLKSNFLIFFDIIKFKF